MTLEVVGPVVGAISNTPASTAAERYRREGVRFDYAIGGLPFVDAASDERPYARETAEFRKEQIDLSSVPGDQSLTGMWTRGQMSFHRGAGVNFYEVGEGQEILNRFKTSMGVDPWTPGEVTLKPELTSLSVTAAADVVPFGDNLVILHPGGACYELTLTGTETARPSSNSGDFSGICSDGPNVYAANGAYIEELNPSDTSFTVLWTHHVAGRTWDKVWWAKNRIWAVDNTGEWYTLDPVGGTTSSSDILWTSGRSGEHWSLADSEGGVFIATGNTVWLSMVDTSVVTPTPMVPVAVATVGAQEQISALGAYLGYLCVLSDAGARIGLIQQSGVAMGPVSVPDDFSNCRRVGYTRSLMVVGGVKDSRDTIYEIAPLEQSATLQAGYAPARDLGAASATTGAFVLSDRRAVLFSAAGVWIEGTDPLASGSVETGQHRFGTLEPKDFRTLTVRATGGGSILVEKILRDGTAVSILTLGPSNYYENIIELGLSGPIDSVGLRFTLQSDVNGNSPRLLGYQLRAIPAPKRQRLIQVPLLCFDRETVGRVMRGYDGWAWDRLEALEAAESRGAAMLFQDFTTGEAAVVAIERVQFQRSTPMKGNGEGWGGFLVLTLRKID